MIKKEKANAQQRFGAIGVLGNSPRRMVLYLEVSVLNRYIWLTKSPTDAKPRNVGRNAAKKVKKMKLITKKHIEKPIGGLFMMIINTTIWGFISEYYLENKDLRILGIILGAIIVSFLYFYFKFVNTQKNLIKNLSEKSAEEKSKEKWFLIIMGLEGLGIIVVKNILVNINQNKFFIPFFALIVGLHFFPLAKIFERKLDYYMGIWTCLISILGFFLIQQKITTENIGNSIVSLGCAISTISYGIRMINEGKKILNI
jgi:hypothetical protein